MKSKLFTACDEVKVFRDPIHGYIHVNYQIIYDLIACPSFQRLRRIKQLGATYVVYPSADHSRFSHSLGVYEITRRIITENTSISEELSEQEKIYVLIAALVHDIGHGPFSHVFEKISHINHEEVGKKLLLTGSDINNILETYQTGLSAIVASIIDHSYPKKICWQIISSQLDADRMDYLLRDAYFTGTKYGEFDLERILRTLRVKDHALVVKASGIYAVEDYLMARFHMFWQVYYHINIRIFEQMLVALANRISQMPLSSDDEFNHFEKLINPKTIDLKRYLNLDDGSMTELLKKLSRHSDPIIKDLASRLLNRELFKEYLFEQKVYAEAQKALISKGIDPEYYLLKEDHGFNATRPYESNGKEKINILMKDGNVVEFSKASAIMKSLSQANEVHENYFFTIANLK